jgi:16S rRNA (guanine527-N7)-methyltransferase
MIKHVVEETPTATLQQGAAQLGLNLTDTQIETLYNYLILLDKWNNVHNLTAIRDRSRMLSHHLLDSLSIHAYVQGPRLLDVGTGAGLPGLVLAVVFPHWHWVLLDSQAKKTRFLTQAMMELGLSNIEVVNTRAESYRPTQPFNTVVTRAVSSLADLVKLTRHLWTPSGSLLAMKADLSKAELGVLNEPDLELQVHPLQVPMLKAKRCLAVLKSRSS